MANDATLRIGADTRDAERALGGLQRSLQALAVGFVTREIFALADASTVLNNKLRSVTGSIEASQQALADVSRIATTTGSSLEAVGDLYQKISLQSQNLGLTQREVARVTENFSKALVITGTTGAAASSAIYQFAQALGRGRVAYEDIRQLQESSSATVALIARQFSMSGQDFVEAVQKGRISSEQLALAVNSLGPEVDKTFGGMNRTIGQSMENIRTSFILMIGEFEKSTGAFNGLAKLLDILAKNMDTVVVAGLTFFGVFAAKKVYDIATAFKTLNSVMARNPVLLLAVGAASAIALITELLDKNEDLTKEQEKQIDNTEAIRKVENARTDVAREQLKTLTEYLTKAQNQAQIAGLFGEELEIRRAIIDAANQLKIPEKELTQEVRNRVVAIKQLEMNNRALGETQQYLIRLGEEISVASVGDRREQEIIKGLLDYRRTVTAEIYNQQKANVEFMLRERQIRQEINQLEQGLLDRERQRAGGIAIQLENYQKLLTHANDLNGAIRQSREINENLDELLKGQLSIDAQIALEYDKQLQNLLAINNALVLNLNNTDDRIDKEYRLSQIQAEMARLQTEMAYKQHDLRMRQEEQYQDQVRKTFEIYYKEQGLSTQQAKDYAQERADFEKKTEREKAQWAINQGASVFTELGKYNRQAFEASKALNIAQAIMNTYTGVTKALAVYPPPFNFIAAGATLAFGLAQIATIRSQQYSGRAIGGPVIKDSPYIVGENGPEMFVPQGSGRVVANNQLGGGTTNINFTIQAVDAAGVDQLLEQRRPMIVNMIRSAMNDRGNKATV